MGLKITHYPFKDVVFSKDTKILIDTCFFVSLLNDKDPKNSDCMALLRTFLVYECALYINELISAEFINQISKKLFVNDIRYKIDKTNPVNTPANINLITACFGKHDRKLIKDKRLEKFHNIPFNKYFYNIHKNEWKRDLLKIYFDKSVEMHSQFESGLKLKHAYINRLTTDLAKDIMCNHMLPINDAYLLACANTNNIPYLLTLDGDFDIIDQDNQLPVTILKI